MPEPSTDQLFYLPGLQERKAERTRRIAELLGSSLGGHGPTGAAVAHAVAHHLLEGAEQAAANRNGDLLSWYRRTELRDLAYLASTDSAGSAHLLLNPEDGHLLQSPLSETAYYLVAPETSVAPAALHELLATALDSARKHGFGGLVDQYAPIVCLLERRELRDTLFSWSITRLPGTVFTDYTSAPEVLARDLVHEAGHHWFNEALATASVSLPEDVTFHSPWRETERPAFGFLHACWAFSLTVIYSAAVLDSAPPPVQAFLRDYLAGQGRLLRAAVPNFGEAASLITSEQLRERVSGAVDAALRCAQELPEPSEEVSSC
ncbi:aKG-HExxH-type peptide beta-hydroxylase [Kitasatospora sp. NPDC101183]|uniref:aKG-HExxH-type peptide beta-hydroxylase n=1 Tax=Kitasatospora sp. NPDC101183 TaxID=3364100 RepID=UPI00381F85C0